MIPIIIIIQILQKRGVDVSQIKSQNVSPNFLQEQTKDTKFIIANFIGLTEESKSVLKLEKEYIIYEHDHKYVKTRNPAEYKDFIAPRDQIINFDFYKNSKAVLCQSDFHAKIVKANLCFS